MNLETERIKHKSGRTENSCSCTGCKKMCRVCPCIGTPEDILRLMNHGHINSLAPTVWKTAQVLGVGEPLNMIQPIYNTDKLSCDFLDPNGLCSLHAAGLKPTEGKLATHTNMGKTYSPDELKKQLTFVVADRWNLVSNLETMRTIFKGYVKHAERQPTIEHQTFYLPAAEGNDR